MTTQGTTHADIPRHLMIEKFGDSLEFDKPLAPFTGYQTGGPAKYFVEAHSAAEVERAVRSANELNVPFFLIGGGSNLLVSDDGFDGLVVRIDIKELRLVDDSTVDCGAGEDLMALVDYCADHGLSGIEFAAGIAGTVGGAKVYERHANIIVNTGTATSKDIRRLADMMKKKVHDRFGVDLEEEVIQIGTISNAE